MKKTTLYLPDDLKDRIERIAERDDLSEADVIRGAIVTGLSGRQPPAPKIPLFSKELKDPRLAERVDELLDGFGQ
jgi:hypothetical protein